MGECILRDSALGNGGGEGKEGHAKKHLDDDGWGGVGKVRL